MSYLIRCNAAVILLIKYYYYSRQSRNHQERRAAGKEHCGSTATPLATSSSDQSSANRSAQKSTKPAKARTTGRTGCGTETTPEPLWRRTPSTSTRPGSWVKSMTSLPLRWWTRRAPWCWTWDSITCRMWTSLSIRSWSPGRSQCLRERTSLLMEFRGNATEEIWFGRRPRRLTRRSMATRGREKCTGMTFGSWIIRYALASTLLFIV